MTEHNGCPDTIMETLTMSETHFIVEEAPEGGFTARAVGADIFTEADNLPELHEQVRDAVRCHFDADVKTMLRRC